MRETGYSSNSFGAKSSWARPDGAWPLHRRATGARVPGQVPGACSPRRHHAGALLRKPRNEQEMTEPPRRVVGKRQVRPNLSRTDFGYTERPRVPVQKAAKKVKRDEEEEGGATGASDRPARADKDSRSLVREHTPDQGGRPTRALALSLPSLARSSPCSSLRLRLPLCLSRDFDLMCSPSSLVQTVDFTKLDMATLKRYKRHYRLKTRQNVTKTELALAVAKHFASQHVDEVRPPAARAPAFAAAHPDIHRLAWQAETIQLFVYSARSSTLHYGACPARRKKASPTALAEPQPRHAHASAPALLRCAPCHTWQTVATTSMAMGDDLLARFNVCDSYGMALDPTVQPQG